MDAQYVLRILLTARDDISRTIENLNNRVGRSFDQMRERFRGFGRDADGMSRSVRAANRTLEDNDYWFGRLFKSISGAKDQMQQMGQTSQGLRGILITLVLAAIQPLVTALLALVGALVSVASSATLAAGALGGIMLASVTQAIPAVGLLVAAFARLGAVIEAVKLATKAQESASKDATSQMLRERAAADQIRAAQDALKASTEGLADAKLRQRDAQRALIDARAEAVRQLQDLVLAEREAQLAAEGATLSQDEAQRRLARSIRSGATAADIARDELGVRGARLDAEQAARGLSATAAARRGAAGGVENQEITVTARRNLALATRGLAAAEKQVADARRNLSRANEDAARTGSELATAQENLNKALANLSPAERALFTAIQRLQTVYKTAFRPITDIIVNAFTDAVNMIVDVLQDKSVLGGFQALATGIADSIRIIMQGATSPEAREFWTFMMREGAKNAPVLARAFVSFATAMSRIATAASPLVSRFFEGLADSMERFAKFTENRERLDSFFEVAGEHLVAWKELAAAVLDFFGALIGASAESGLKIVQDIAVTFRNWADDLRSNKREAVAFFEDSRRSAKYLWDILVALGQAMMVVFDPNSLEALRNILVNVVIPAIAEAVDIIGKVLELVGVLFGNPIIAGIAKFALTVGFVVLGMNAFLKVARLAMALFAVNPIVLFIAAVLVILYKLEQRWHVFSRLYNWIRENWSRLDDIILKPFRDALDWITEHWKDLLIAFFTGIPGLLWRALTSDWASGFADKFKELLTELKDWIKDKFIDPVVNFFKDLPGRFFGGVKDLGTGIAKRIPKGPLGDVGSGPSDVGAVAGVLSADSTINRALWDELGLAEAMGLTLTSGYRPGAVTKHGTPSDHGTFPSKAIDVSGSSSLMAAFFRRLIGNRGVRQAFYDPLGSIFGGALSGYREGGHSDHVHVATYAHGGVVKPVPGGVYRVAEAGHPEMIIPLDPARRSRARQLLNLTHRAVGFADGGIPDVFSRALGQRRLANTPQISVADAAAMGFAELLNSIRKLGSHSRQLVRSMTNVLEELGLRFEDIRSDLEVSVRKRALRLRQQVIGIVGGRPTRLLNEAQEQQATIASLGDTRGELLGERSSLTQALSALQRRLRVAVNPVVKAQLTAAITSLEGKILENAESLQDNLEAQASAYDRLTQIEEQAAQDRIRAAQERIDAINASAGAQLGALSLTGRIAQFFGGGTRAALSNNASRLGVLRNQLGALAGQGQTVAGGVDLGALGLGGLIGASGTGSEDANNVLNQILDVLEESRQLQEQAWMDQVDAINKVADRTLRMNDIMTRISEITGDSTAQLRLLNERGAALESQRLQLQALLATAVTADQRADLELSIAELQLALLENTEAIKTLSGANNTQTFTSSAWQLFRNAIFNGSGGLLPQFSIPQGGLMPSFAFGGIAAPAVSGSDQYHVHVTNPTEVLDPGWVAKRFAFELRLSRR